MQVPLEISFQNMEQPESAEALIREKVAKLEKICDYISSCRVDVDKPQEHRTSGNPYRVRIDITIPPGHEIVVDRNLGQDAMHLNLEAVIRDAFDRAERQVKRLMDKQRGDVKVHPDQQTVALVSKLFPEQGYGFLRSVDGRDIYFHKNSVLNDDFDRLKVGTGVNYFEEMGENGAQASNVQIVNKPG